ncbi:MAG: aminotransferase class III-fold pyridoxal phosphate-dependent enzyme [Polyangiaceae bacterium]|nr:aminotransferase class III-fold pyridoxal phosphate-dependent enzyme [Polyangiaceae bacterium]
MIDIEALIEEQLNEASRLNKKYVHPKLTKMFAIAGMEAFFHRGEGQYLWDAKGNRYLDFLSSGGVSFLGRNNPAVKAAVAKVAELDLPNLTILNPSLLGGLLAKRLIELAGGHFGKVLFSNTGTETTDLALRFARYCTRRRRFLYLEGAFHGRTYASISCCGFPPLREGMEPLMPTTTPIRINDLAQLRRELKYGDVAAFIFETVQGMTGEVMDPIYLKEAEALCRQHGTLLLADEVQTGLGRTGKWFDSVGQGVRPDMMMVSKTLSGGLVPIGATLVQDDVYQRVYDRFQAGAFYFSTFAENNLAMAAGLATLDSLEEMNAPEEAERKGKLIEDGVNELASRYDCIERITGKGLLRAIYFRTSELPKLRTEQTLLDASDPSAFAAALHIDIYRDYRIMLQIPGPGLNAIKFLPPICTSDSDIYFFLQALDETLGRYYTGTGPAIGIGSAAAKHFVGEAVQRLVPVRAAKRAEAEGSARVVLPKPGNGAVRVLPTAPPGNGAAATEIDLEAFELDNFYEHGDYHGPMVEKCDFLVVGGGPAGVMAARRLAEAGRDVILLEAGRRLTESDFGYDLMNTSARYFWDSAVKPSRGNNFTSSLRVKALGGGSVFNSAICMRASDWALAAWAENAGVEGITNEALLPHYERIESFLGIAPTDERIMRRRNLVIRDGCRALGWKVEPLPRLTPRCTGTAECVTGCRVGGKNSVDRRGVPEILRAGGRVFTGLQADRIILRDGRVLGIEGFVVDPETGKRSHSAKILAKCTVLAAGVFSTPVLCQRGGLSRSVIGSNLRMHPSGHAVGVYDEEIVPWEGATQGYHCLEFMEQGTKIEDLWATTGIFALRFPSLGAEFTDYLARFRNMAVIAGWVGGEDSVGRVRALPGGYVDASYDIGEGDVRRLQQLMVSMGEILFAGGAKEALMRFGGKSPVLRSVQDLHRRVRDMPCTVADLNIASNHCYGTMPMGGDRERSATDSWGKVWDCENLFVCDTSLFPTSSGSNPMHPAMALADRQAEALLRWY